MKAEYPETGAVWFGWPTRVALSVCFPLAPPPPAPAPQRTQSGSVDHTMVSDSGLLRCQSSQTGRWSEVDVGWAHAILRVVSGFSRPDKLEVISTFQECCERYAMCVTAVIIPQFMDGIEVP
ncbi:hypothetical protein ABEB36_000431 [Hypothenemus hampei]|uniref:Uncharacterized protein n=1 Tax=Hypothenemus hampei TaxID=57062 RepID=A0ABD1FB59_HYPHA